MIELSNVVVANTSSLVSLDGVNRLDVSPSTRFKFDDLVPVLLDGVQDIRNFIGTAKLRRDGDRILADLSILNNRVPKKPLYPCLHGLVSRRDGTLEVGDFKVRSLSLSPGGNIDKSVEPIDFSKYEIVHVEFLDLQGQVEKEGWTKGKTYSLMPGSDCDELTEYHKGGRTIAIGSDEAGMGYIGRDGRSPEPMIKGDPL